MFRRRTVVLWFAVPVAVWFVSASTPAAAGRYEILINLISDTVPRVVRTHISNPQDVPDGRFAPPLAMGCECRRVRFER